MARTKVGVEQAYSYIRAVMTQESEPKSVGGTIRATQRPAHIRAPEGWTNPPVPEPEPIREDKAEDQPGGRNPVRYGDWELKGLAIDF